MRNYTITILDHINNEVITKTITNNDSKWIEETLFAELGLSIDNVHYMVRPGYEVPCNEFDNVTTILNLLEKGYVTDSEGDEMSTVDFLSYNIGGEFTLGGVTAEYLGDEYLDVNVEDGWYSKRFYIRIGSRIFGLEYTWSFCANELGEDECEYVDTTEFTDYTPATYTVRRDYSAITQKNFTHINK